MKVFKYAIILSAFLAGINSDLLAKEITKSPKKITHVTKKNTNPKKQRA